ncbi:hypothetical protein ACNVED_09965 [Legionella sp. D16C41]|uniref:hypothetical protein n=1 Tax=Legionella sp. D16C41 TaxID=3402688 RepID=UPI003AF99531
MANSTIAPNNLIKVNNTNNPQCVTYYHYQGEVYCSTVKLPTSDSYISETVKNSEQQHIIFDHRLWQAAWGKQDNITTIEYIPSDENINNWHELITTQYIPKSIKEITPKEYLDITLNSFKREELNPKIIIHEQTPQEIIFEFQLSSPANLVQDELQKITQTPKGLYILHYVIKKSDMGENNRQMWLNNLKASTIK